MTPEFESKLNAKLAAFQNWSENRSFQAARLVQYVSREPYGIDVALDDVLRQIRGLVCEGMRVDWSEFQNCLYLRVWEFPNPEPEWPKVYAEEPLDAP